MISGLNLDLFLCAPFHFQLIRANKQARAPNNPPDYDKSIRGGHPFPSLPPPPSSHSSHSSHSTLHAPLTLDQPLPLINHFSLSAYKEEAEETVETGKLEIN